MEKFGIDMGPRVTLVGPQSYMEFLNLWKDARMVLTDSGGMQEETTALGVPCITLRENTERPITIDEGTNVLAGTDADQNRRARRRLPPRPPAAKLRRRWGSVHDERDVRQAVASTSHEPLLELMPRAVPARHGWRKGQRPDASAKQISVECRMDEAALNRTDEPAVLGQPTEHEPGCRSRTEPGHVGKQRVQRCLDHLVVD